MNKPVGSQTAAKDIGRIKVSPLIFGLSLQKVIIWYKSFFDSVFNSMCLISCICGYFGAMGYTVLYLLISSVQ